MNETGRDRADGARMSHAEAERLISARLDAPLDPTLNRALLAHLATCDSCRAFAARMEAMSTGLRALPVLPASPLVSRQVRAKIAQPDSPWARLSTMLFNGRWGAIPAAAAGVALVAVVAVALILHGSGPDGASPLAAPSMTHFAATATSQAAATASETSQPDTALEVAASMTPKFPNIQVTATPTATNTAQPTETATVPPAPTETATAAPTDTPEATATAQSAATETGTAAPSPTASETPAATVTAAPTETATVEPTATATPEPTETATLSPTDIATAQPTETETPAPTATAAPTDTETATVEPTIGAVIAPVETATATATATEIATPLPAPTETPKPTKTPRPTKTATTTPSAPPTIAPAGGQTSNVVETPALGDGNASNAAPETGNSSAANETPTSPAIVASGNATGDGTSIPETTPAGGAIVSEITATAKPTRKSDGSKETSTAAPGSSSLSNAQTLAPFGASVEPGAIVRANPNADLFAVADSAGCTIYDFNGNVVGSIPGGAEPVWTPGGTALLLSAPSDAGQTATVWLAKSQSSFAISAPSDKSYVDHPAGADAVAFYFVRAFADGSGLEVHKTLFEDNSDSAIWSGSGQLSGQPVVTDAGVIVAVDGKFHVIDASGNESSLGSDPFGAMQAPVRSPNGSGIAFIAGDKLIVAASGQPSNGASIAYSTGGGFAFSRSGGELVVAASGALSVYSSDGTLEGQVAADGVAVVAWRSDGIVALVDNGQPRLVLIAPGDLKTSGG